MHTTAPIETPSRRWLGSHAPSAIDRRIAACVVAGAVTSAIVLLLSGSVGAAAVPAIVMALAYAMWRLPLRVSILVYLFPAAIAFDPPRSLRAQFETLASGFLWTGFLRPLNDILDVYLSHVTGIGALALTGEELLYLIFVVLMIARSVRGDDIDRVGRIPGTNALFAVCGISLATLAWLELLGLARGGDARASFFQVRHLLFLPVLTVVFSHGLRDVRDFTRAAVVVTAGACVKIALGAYFLVHDAWPRGSQPEFMTGHHDSVLYVGVLLLWVAAWVHHPRARTVLPTVAVLAWILTGLVLNDRRISYVSLVAGVALLYLLLRGRMKRRMTRALVFALPLLIVYLLIARTHPTGIFAPAAELMSVSDRTDPSNVWRDVENHNLVVTIQAHEFAGSGWGHEYIEVTKAADISMWMPQYRLVAHNSILWLLGITGMFAFSLVWMPIPVAIFLATRSYRFARSSTERTAAFAVLGVLVSYLGQSWGDMGTQGSYSIALVACALALSGKLARATGAWPADIRLIEGPPR